MQYYLEPTQYDTRKSFYKKAVVEEHESYIVLYSYDVKVARIHKPTDTVEVFGWYSPTTARHINEFLAQNGFPTLCKKEMENKDLFPMTHVGLRFTEPEIITETEPAIDIAENNYNYLFGYTDKI